MEFIEAKHPEWSDMWEDLALLARNAGDPIGLNDGACWEYMGSSDNHHHFRHLKHPATGAKEFAYIERRRVHVAWAS